MVVKQTLRQGKGWHEEKRKTLEDSGTDLGDTQVIDTGQFHWTDRYIQEHAEYIHTKADYKQDTGGRRKGEKNIHTEDGTSK